MTFSEMAWIVYTLIVTKLIVTLNVFIYTRNQVDSVSVNKEEIEHSIKVLRNVSAYTKKMKTQQLKSCPPYYRN